MMLFLFCLLTPKPAEAGTLTRYQGLHTAVRKAGPLIPQIQQANATDQDQMLCMALNIYHEIRGGTSRDQWAVAFVTINRTKRSAFRARSVCAVVWSPSQFSWTRKPMKAQIPREKSAWAESQRKAALILTGERMNDPTNGATHFSRSLNQSWARNLVNKVRIGAHWFARLPGSN
jgi:spore germination cell wall hydrolase CwlJ-like protein